jgi:isochorismate pyruvate lyase
LRIGQGRGKRRAKADLTEADAMTKSHKPAQDCATMAEVRAGIDRIDACLVALLAERMGYIDRAAELKPAIGMPARVRSRVEEVVARVRSASAGRGLDPDLAEALWRRLIEWSIAREERVLGKDPDEETVPGPVRP